MDMMARIPARASKCRSVAPGDLVIAEVDCGILVTGSRSGRSSVRTKAPKAWHLANVGRIVAKSFARIFLRDAHQVGRPIIECSGARDLAKDGGRLEVDLIGSVVKNCDWGRVALPFDRRFSCQGV